MAEVLELRSPLTGPLDFAATAVESARCPLSTNLLTAPPSPLPSTLFDRCWRQYALCREHLFIDHTRQIASALAPMLTGSGPRHIVEAGCGPGFYSRRLAARFPQLHLTGIDLCEPLLYRAQQRAQLAGLDNCRFLKADALSLAEFPNQIDAVIASRFFLILAQPALTLDAIFIALRPGGVCFIAEPVSRLRAAVPLLVMKMTERLGGSAAPVGPLPQSRVLSGSDFESLVASQPWKNVRIWKDRQYHCAVCTKAA